MWIDDIKKIDKEKVLTSAMSMDIDMFGRIDEEFDYIENPSELERFVENILYESVPRNKVEIQFIQTRPNYDTISYSIFFTDKNTEEKFVVESMISIDDKIIDAIMRIVEEIINYDMNIVRIMGVNINLSDYMSEEEMKEHRQYIKEYVESDEFVYNLLRGIINVRE